MNIIRSLFSITWRSIFVALGYFAGLMVGGIASAMLGAQMPASSEGTMKWLFVASFLLGIFICPLAMRLSLTRRQQFILWLFVIFFNLGSVAIEGKFFAPDLVPLPLWALFTQQLLASAGAALVISLICKKAVKSVSWLEVLRNRTWLAWLWRFVVSAASYLAFYFIFGALNYSLVTEPYYASHAGGLTALAPGTVLLAELVRAPLIVLSILLFLLSLQGKKLELMLKAGWMLFAVGGVIPLVFQIGALPLLLLAASAVEIFFQNFLTGAVSAWLLGVEKS
jgi:hypothetical protein